MSEFENNHKTRSDFEHGSALYGDDFSAESNISRTAEPTLGFIRSAINTVREAYGAHRTLATGGAIGVSLFGGAALIEATVAEGNPASHNPPPYAPQICSEIVGRNGPASLHAQYLRDSKSKLSVKVKVDSIEACNVNGTRTVKFYQEQSIDNGETYERTSSKGSLRGNRTLVRTSTLRAPYDCNDLAGKDVKTRMTADVNWNAKKGRGKDTTASYHYRTTSPKC